MGEGEWGWDFTASLFFGLLPQLPADFPAPVSHLRGSTINLIGSAAPQVSMTHQSVAAAPLLCQPFTYTLKGSYTICASTHATVSSGVNLYFSRGNFTRLQYAENCRIWSEIITCDMTYITVIANMTPCGGRRSVGRIKKRQKLQFHTSEGE